MLCQREIFSIVKLCVCYCNPNFLFFRFSDHFLFNYDSDTIFVKILVNIRFAKLRDVGGLMPIYLYVFFTLFTGKGVREVKLFLGPVELELLRSFFSKMKSHF